MRGVRALIADRVAPGAADKQIRAGAAVQQVVTRAAQQDISASITGQGIVMPRTDEIFNADQGVAVRLAQVTGAGGQIDAHRLRGLVIADAVANAIGRLTAAVEAVGAKAALQNIIDHAAGVDTVHTGYGNYGVE